MLGNCFSMDWTLQFTERDMRKEPDLSTTGELLSLSDDQRRQVLNQLEKHGGIGRHTAEIVFSEGGRLHDFAVYPEVLRPIGMVSFYLASYLYKEKQWYAGKSALDIGCGSGIQGITMAVGGAKEIIMADISPQAVANTKENIERFRLSNKARVIQSDLFENIQDTADVIVFNHPFFPAEPIKGVPLSISMLDSGKLIHRFLEDSKSHLRAGGCIIMPYLQSAGETNDPEIQAPKHGFKVSVVFRQNGYTGWQKGLISIYHLELER